MVVLKSSYSSNRPIVQNSQRGKELEEILSPNSSDDICLVFCIYPSSMVESRPSHIYSTYVANGMTGAESQVVNHHERGGGVVKVSTRTQIGALRNSVEQLSQKENIFANNFAKLEKCKSDMMQKKFHNNWRKNFAGNLITRLYVGPSAYPDWPGRLCAPGCCDDTRQGLVATPQKQETAAGRLHRGEGICRLQPDLWRFL